MDKIMQDLKYFLTSLSLDNQQKIEIDKVKFDTLKAAKNCLYAGLAIEEKYELLISNFIELEKEIAIVLTNKMVRADAEYVNLFDDRMRFNRRIVNLLTSTKMYVDQLTKQVRACIPGRKDIESKIKVLLSEEYDANFEFRFMEALRNHVQHCGLAIHIFNNGFRWTKEENSHLEQNHIK